MAEAKTVVEKIGRNLLQCAICCDQYQDPRALSCHHGFCLDCLKGWGRNSTRKKGTLECPMCRALTDLPKGGASSLPVHFIVNSLQDIVDEERHDVTCSNCNDPVKKATFHCFDCKDSICKTCETYHKTFKALREHRIVTIEEFLSGKATDEGRICKLHGEVVRYFCRTEQLSVCQDCVSLKTCQLEHERIFLKDASKEQVVVLEELIKTCDDTKLKLAKAVRQTELVAEVLERSKILAMSNALQIQTDCILEIKEVSLKHQAEIGRVSKERAYELDDHKKRLEGHLSQLEEACRVALVTIQSGSPYQITTSFASLSDSLQGLNQIQPTSSDDAFGHLKYQRVPSPLPIIGCLVGIAWKQMGSFSIPFMSHGITINNHGNIAVTSWDSGVRVFTKTGLVKCVFKDTPDEVYDIATTPDDRFVIDGDEVLLCYDDGGNKLSEISTWIQMDNSSAIPLGVTVDKAGRIITGLSNRTVSIHHADGTSISTFMTQAKPHRLAATGNRQLVVAFDDDTLQLVDYSGTNAIVIQPPVDVREWIPGYVCCSQTYGEIFVVNEGQPKAVYGYSFDGEYLGRVTAEVHNPYGIAVSDDGLELYVVEHRDNKVKIFQR